jgi:hypothetical protein
MRWTLHSELFKPFPAVIEFVFLLLTETADLSTKFINPCDWKEFFVELA